MARILTCIEGVGDSGICPAGMIPELVDGYIFAADPTAFDPSIAAQYFAFSFGTVLGLFVLARGAGFVLDMFMK